MAIREREVLAALRCWVPVMCAVAGCSVVSAVAGCSDAEAARSASTSAGMPAQEPSPDGTLATSAGGAGGLSRLDSMGGTQGASTGASSRARGAAQASAGMGIPSSSASTAGSAGTTPVSAAGARDSVAGTSARVADAGIGAVPAIDAAGAGSAAGAGVLGGTAGVAGRQAGMEAAAGARASGPSFVRLELLGDSITETTCTSQLVFDRLRADGHKNFDLVGTRRNEQGCGVDEPDRDCEGHSGYLVTDLPPGRPKAAELPMWCEADKADVVLMHFGTNDAWNSGVPIADIVSAYSAVLAALRAVQPQVVVFVAQIIPLRPDGCGECDRRVRELNEQIPMWASSESSPESPIYVVDQYRGFDAGQDTGDGVHPNLKGAQKMADAWVAALYERGVF